MIKKNCAFYRKEDNKCLILKGFYAGKDGCGTCSFFKTPEQAERDKVQAEKAYLKHTGWTIEEYQLRLAGRTQ